MVSNDPFSGIMNINDFSEASIQALKIEQAKV
jgi:hypothetical protein